MPGVRIIVLNQLELLYTLCKEIGEGPPGTPFS